MKTLFFPPDLNMNDGRYVMVLSPNGSINSVPASAASQ
jgi:hypothetical protein